MRDVNAVDAYIRWNPQSALFEPNWAKRDILPFWLYPQTDVVNGDIAVTPTSSPTLLYKLPHSSPGQNESIGNPLQVNELVFLEKTVGANLAAYTVMVKDMGDRTQFMNAPVHVQTFAGTGQLAARLSEDLFLPTRHDLMVTFGYLPQLSGSTPNYATRLFFCGKQYYPWSTNLQNKPADLEEMKQLINQKLERRKYLYPFWLTTDGGVVNVPANGTVEADMSIGDDGAFEATHILTAWPSNSSANFQGFTLQIYDPQNRQLFSNGPISSQMLGNAQNPQPLPAPLLVPAGQVLRCSITDTSGTSGGNNVYITLRGYKCRAKIQSYADSMREFGIPVPMKTVKEEQHTAHKHAAQKASA